MTRSIVAYVKGYVMLLDYVTIINHRLSNLQIYTYRTERLQGFVSKGRQTQSFYDASVVSMSVSRLYLKNRNRQLKFRQSYTHTALRQ